MLGLTLREEFQGKRLKGTAIELANDNNTGAKRTLLHETIEPMLAHELQRREIVPKGGSYAAKLIGWVEVRGA